MSHALHTSQGESRRIQFWNGGFVLIFTAILLMWRLPELPRKALVNIGEMLPAWGAGALGVWYFRRFRQARPDGFWGWVLLGVAGFGYAIGQTIWTWYEIVARVESPFPSWADGAFLTAQMSTICGVFVLFGSMARTGRLRLLLDSAIAVSSVAILSWYLLINHLWQQSGKSTLTKFIGVSYPLMDIVAVYGAVVLLSQLTSAHNRRPIALLVGGVSLFAIADTAFTYYTMHSAFRTGSWMDAGWAFGWLLNMNALYLQIRYEQAVLAPPAETLVEPVQVLAETNGVPEIATSPVALLRLLVPYAVAAITGLCIALYEYSTERLISASVLSWIGVLTVLVITRQFLTLVENRQLTQQVAALLQFTKSLNDTLHIDEVLNIATNAVRRLVTVQGVVLWVVQPEGRLKARRKEDVASTALPPHCAQWGLDEHEDAVSELVRCPIEKNLLSSNALNVQVCCPAALHPHLLVPLMHNGKMVGAMALVRRTHPFTSDEHMLLEGIASEIGTVVANALSYRAAVEAADCDPVTGLFNHRAIHQRLQIEWDKAARKNSEVTVIMMDMNNFKFFNDTYGHPAGDEVLRNVADVLRDVCRTSDILGRYGGDEYIAILPDTDRSGGVRVTERLRERFAKEGFHAPDGHTIPISLSFGVASYPEDSAVRGELIGLADANLYKAKLSKNKIGITSEVRRGENLLREDESYVFLEGLVTAVDNKDRYTRRHSEDVTQYALWIGEELGVTDDEMRALRIGGLLHDVGKIGVPDHVLRKPGALSDEEFALIKRHPELGAVIVAGVASMKPIVGIVRSHHERYDGKGYPDGLRGEEIPFLARIVAVTDAFSAMTTTRPYRRAMPLPKALSVIEENIGTQFDPQAAHAFLRVFAKYHANHEEVEDHADETQVLAAALAESPENNAAL